MKTNANFKKIIASVILATILLCTASCSQNDDEPSTPNTQANIQKDVYEEKIAYCLEQIADLEARLAEKKQEIYVSESSYQLEISALEATIASLKSQLDSLSASINTEGNNDTGNSDSTQVGNTQNSKPNESATSQFTYIKENNGITITKYTGGDTEVAIPDKIEGLPVLCIGESAFASCRVKSVIIPEGVKKIDWFAFQACTQLTEITIPASVTKIEYGAFEYAKPSFIIKCPKGSFAEAYAKSWGYICVTG